MCHVSVLLRACEPKTHSWATAANATHEIGDWLSHLPELPSISSLSEFCERTQVLHFLGHSWFYRIVNFISKGETTRIGNKCVIKYFICICKLGKNSLQGPGPDNWFRGQCWCWTDVLLCLGQVLLSSLFACSGFGS